MKKLFFIAITFIVIFCTACDKESDFIRDNTTATGTGSIPVSANPLSDAISKKSLSTSLTASTVKFAAGTVLSIELQYFSQSPIKEVNLFETVGAGARTQVYNKAYTPTFSDIKRLDTLMIPYTVPMAASNTGIKLEFEIVNQNTLKLTRTAWLRIL
ncbi:MAG: hypothetical protein ABIO05_03165 [Ferruginibacter sp.]